MPSTREKLTALNVDSQVKLYSPVDGVIRRLTKERPRSPGTGGPAGYSGHQIKIRVAGNDTSNVVLYHVTLAPDVRNEMPVKAGQLLGYANTKGSSFDIGLFLFAQPIQAFSYFEVMPERLFPDWQKYGIESRSDLVLSKEYRDSHPVP